MLNDQEQDMVTDSHTDLAMNESLNTDESYGLKEEGKSDLIRWQQDVINDELVPVIHELRNEFQDVDGVWKTLKNEDPIMNELGIKQFVSLVRPNLSRNLMMSNYDEDRIYVNLRDSVSRFIIHFAYNMEQYQLKKENYRPVIGLFKRLIEPAHFRSLGAGERKAQSEINKRVDAHTYAENPNGEKQNIVKKMFG